MGRWELSHGPLDESHATYHINLGAAWFSQKKMERAIAEYIRAIELDPEAFRHDRTGVAAQIASPEERAQHNYLLAKAYARRGDLSGCVRCLRKAKEDGHRNLGNVYRDEEFSLLRDNPKLQEMVPRRSRSRTRLPRLLLRFILLSAGRSPAGLVLLSNPGGGGCE